MSEVAALQTTDKKKILSNLELLEMFLEDSEYRGVTKEQIVNYKSNLKIFFSIIKTPALEIGASELKRFLKYLREEAKGRSKEIEKGLADNTINSYYSSLYALYDFLEFKGNVIKNPIPPFRRRYLRFLKKRYYGGNGGSDRQLISIEDMRKLINSITYPRDKAVVTILAKTGVRRGELVRMDEEDINWVEQSIKLKPFRKRTNRTVFFDDECPRILRRWLYSRDNAYDLDGGKALFLNERGGRLNRNGVYSIVTRYAERLGLHDPKGKLNEKFTPHCFRHWFTTWLRRAGMKREFIKELRGDSRHETIDIYDHIDKKELRDSYLAYIPQLGI